MEILKSEIDLKIFGQDYKIKPPTAIVAAEFNKEISSLNDEVETIKKAIAFLDSLGLPSAVGEQLELHHLQKIIELIASKKK